jgi:hypothetical protein
MAPFIILIVTVLLMPFFTVRRSWMEKFLFFVFSICLTPLLGIPVYWYIFRR